jgi:D-lactate dehydrogenase (cytochrome)
MPSHRVTAAAPRGDPGSPSISTDPAVLASYEEDAARSRGKAWGVARPRSEAEVASLVRSAALEGRAVLAQGARSSLTAGATPRGDLVLALEGMDSFELVGDAARVGPGVRLRDLNERLAPTGLWFPPVPTYDLCCIGGAVSTNAAGAATFKYGPVRPWVRALRVVLASGDVLALRRGLTSSLPPSGAEDGGSFEVATRDGVLSVPLPRYRTPDVKKIACGYFVREPLDLIDLFIGSEGTLGVVTEVEVALSPLPASVVAGAASFPDERSAFAFAAAVRRASEETWRTKDPSGIDARALEWIDAPSLELLRARGKASDAELPPPGGSFVLFEQELPSRLSDDEAASALGAGIAGGSCERPAERALAALGALLAAHGAEDSARVALPHDDSGRRAIARIREVVPETVNELIAERKRADPGVRKVAGDMVVPFERLEEMLGHYRSEFRARGLDSAIFGHISDGNLHANVLARSEAEARRGDEALLALGAIARALGGAPLSEHGVGKSPTKQELLRRFVGDQGVADMARTKRALDPRGVLAPGNIFRQDALG